LAGVAIVTDSTADFAGIEPDDFAITVVPLTVNWGKDVLRDRIDVTTSEFYARLRTDRDVPRTAAPPLGILEEVYRNLLEDHDAVVSVHISAKLSATHGVASAAARNVDDGRVQVVDSTTTTVTLGWLAEAAAALAGDGAAADAIVSRLTELIPRQRIYLTLDTLEYLQRGGRIGRAQAFLGGLLNVKPLLACRDGEVHPVERVRSRAAAIRRVAEITQQLGPKDRIAVAHSDCADEARTFAAEVARRESLSAVAITELGSVVGTHTGPGVLGIGCLLAE
jgi:DegV family protein with EDD domain